MHGRWTVRYNTIGTYHTTATTYHTSRNRHCLARNGANLNSTATQERTVIRGRQTCGIDLSILSTLEDHLPCSNLLSADIHRASDLPFTLLPNHVFHDRHRPRVNPTTAASPIPRHESQGDPHKDPPLHHLWTAQPVSDATKESVDTSTRTAVFPRGQRLDGFRPELFVDDAAPGDAVGV